MLDVYVAIIMAKSLDLYVVILANESLDLYFGNYKYVIA